MYKLSVVLMYNLSAMWTEKLLQVCRTLSSASSDPVLLGTEHFDPEDDWVYEAGGAGISWNLRDGCVSDWECVICRDGNPCHTVISYRSVEF
jgi:hypothetical protein